MDSVEKTPGEVETPDREQQPGTEKRTVGDGVSTAVWTVLILTLLVLAAVEIMQIAEMNAVSHEVSQLLETIRSNRGGGQKEELFHQPDLPLDQTLSAIVRLEQKQEPQSSLTKEQCRKFMTLTLRMRYFIRYRRNQGVAHEEEDKLAGQMWSVLNPHQIERLKTMGEPVPLEELTPTIQTFYSTILNKLKEN